MPRRTIAVGDIHGCALALERLLDAIQPTADDLFVTLGDYVDRGPDSKRVLECLMELSQSSSVKMLMGNHELMMLSAVDSPEELPFWLECGGGATLDSYGGRVDDIPATHLELIRNCLNFYETESHFFVHANYSPETPLSRQRPYSLFWEHLHAYLPTPHCSGKRAIVGHTPQQTGEILILDHLIGIDTHCYGGGWLTALDVDAEVSWQADKMGRLRYVDDHIER